MIFLSLYKHMKQPVFITLFVFESKNQTIIVKYNFFTDKKCFSSHSQSITGPYFVILYYFSVLCLLCNDHKRFQTFSMLFSDSERLFDILLAAITYYNNITFFRMRVNYTYLFIFRKLLHYKNI